MNRATNRSCIFIVLLLLCITQQISSKRTFGGGGSRHSYPSSGGNHGSFGGLSGTSHSRPTGNAYPSNTQSHGYPSNTQSHGYPSNTQSHGYPSSTGLSGNSRPSGGHTTNVHYHYNYNPPQQIRYTPVHGGAPISYPVYHGTPPTYVYKYQDSGSRYGTLLAGLALLNLGTLAGTAYALNRGHSNSYKPAPGEVCKFGLKKENGDYEETRIDCEIISSFIYMEQAKANNVSSTNTTVVTTIVTNVTTINSPQNQTAPAAAGPVLYPNGTLVPRDEITNNTATAANNTDNTMASSVTVTTTNTTTVTNALDVKVIISACWAAGAVVGLLPLFGWHAAVDDSPGCYFVEVMDYNYLLFLYFATIVTPSVLLAGFYAHIYRVVVKQMSAVVTVEGGQGREGTMLRVLGAAQKREVKATQNLAIIVFFFIICWIPLYTINAIKAFMPTLDIPNTLTYFCIIFSHLNSAINPLLYAYHLKDFRAALKGLICVILGRGVPIPAAYRPPVPIRRPALERCNALRERPKIYVDSPVWRRQKEAEVNTEEKSTGAAPSHDCEPFLNAARDSSSGRYTPEAHEGSNGPYLIESNLACQSPYKKVEEFIRRVRSVSAEPS